VSVDTATHGQSVQTSTQGVKPSHSTSHETHAAASSTQTKLYGNGKTAGQIAQQYGASPSTMLHGPGNSQPHKTGCGPHEVDVHALKAHGGAGCAANVKTHEKTEEHGNSNEHGNSGSNGNASESGHVTICHATGSKSHPFVVISPASSGVFHGHMGHQVQEDVVPTFTFNGLTLSQNLTAQGQTMLNSGCTSASTETESSTTTTATTSNAAVITTQQTVQQNTQSTTTSTPQSSAPQNSTPQGSTATPQGASASTTPTTSPAAGNSGVQGAGAQAGNNNGRSSSAAGVAGTSNSKPASGVSGTLPFTGVPLWIGLVVGLGLLAAAVLTRFAASAPR
jgi:hypothetical protein